MQEQKRLEAMLFYENLFIKKGFEKIAGVDEAGRGPLAGPVVAAACILPKNSFFSQLDDSKKLSSFQRDRLFSQITSHPQTVYATGIVDEKTIDEINILQASLLAMQLAIYALKITPDYLLIDGKQAPLTKIPFKTIIRGDSLSLSIAAASVIAKVTRDRLMEHMDEQYPLYGFKKHKGYGTKGHLEALNTLGPCPIHRLSFQPLKGHLQRDEPSLCKRPLKQSIQNDVEKIGHSHPCDDVPDQTPL